MGRNVDGTLYCSRSPSSILSPSFLSSTPLSHVPVDRQQATYCAPRTFGRSIGQSITEEILHTVTLSTLSLSSAWEKANGEIDAWYPCLIVVVASGWTSGRRLAGRRVWLLAILPGTGVTRRFYSMAGPLVDSVGRRCWKEREGRKDGTVEKIASVRGYHSRSP